jgi:hypothetical protein
MNRLWEFTPVADRIWHWGDWACGAALYRTGRYEAAACWFEAAAQSYRPRAWDWSFRAMAHTRLGQLAEARRCLNEAQRWIREANTAEFSDLSDTRPAWGSWHEKVVYPMLVREADALIRASEQSASP